MKMKLFKSILFALGVGVALWLAPANADDRYEHNGRKLDPPQVARTARGQPSSGLKLSGGPPSTALQPKGITALAIPAGAVTPYDLSQWAMPVADQGPVNSCVAWAIDYSQLGWYYAKAGKLPAGSFSPMYTYSQVPGGMVNGYTFPSDHYEVLRLQGDVPRSQYPKGDYNYWEPPTPAEHALAAPYKGPTYTGTNGTWQDQIQAAMAGGNPPVILFYIRPDYANASPSDYYVEVLPDTSWLGNHENIVLKTDVNGVWVQNQWGTGWGLNGWAQLSWDYVAQNVIDLEVMINVDLTTPTVTPTKTPTKTPVVTPTPIKKPTKTPTPTRTPRRNRN